MGKIESFTVSPTENARVGRSSIAEFLYEHIQSMKATNKPEYTAIITESEKLYNEVFSDISQRKQNLSKQVNLTKDVNDVKDEYFDLIDAFDAALILKFKKNSKEQKEVFPKGLSIFKKATIETIKEDMELMEKQGQKFDTALGSAFAVGFKNVKLKYLDTFNKQKSTQTQVKSIIPDYKTKKKLIDKQILKNICTIILSNPDQPDVLLTLFNDKLITPHRKTKTNDDNQLYLLKILAATHIAANFTFTSKDVLLITNNSSTVSIFYYAAATADAAVPATLHEILPDEEVEIAASTLGTGNKYIIFVNKDTTADVEVEIAFI
ncbi:MAG: hypothetical protein HXX18_12890 [Bacteroidetes bacterium]|nr:hypothetical protein [Bacteroidota bacterium]